VPKTKSSSCPIHVVFGKDRRRAIDTVHEITRSVLADADPQLSLRHFEGPDAVLADVLDELRTLPFLSPCRLVVIKEADPFISNYRQKLEKYLEKPSETGVLLLVADSFPGNTRLAKIAKQIGRVYPCELVKPRQLNDYLRDYAARTHQLTLDRNTAALLISLAGDNSGQLSAEIDKIATFLASPGRRRSKITPADIEALVGNNRHYDVFNVIDALTQSDIGRDLERLDRMLSQDRNAEYSAVGAFAWYFRRLYHARLMLDRGAPSAAVIKQLRVWSQPDQFIRQAQRMNISRLAQALKGLMNIDFSSKTGGGSVKSGLEKFIVQFCHGHAATV